MTLLQELIYIDNVMFTTLDAEPELVAEGGAAKNIIWVLFPAGNIK